MRTASLMLLSFLLLPIAHAQSPSKNLALGKPYTLEPAPRYKYCTDPGDTTQLTDGVYTEGHFWTKPGTVGWQRRKNNIVTVDLGAVKPIRGISFNTAAGTAGVSWPLAIYMLVADEDKHFHEAGELVALSAKHGYPPAEGYTIHRYWTDDLKTHGRYVSLVFAAQPYAFVDEIEIYEGDQVWLDTPLPGEPIISIEAHMKRLVVAESVKRRLRWDIDGIRKQVREGQEEIHEELDRLQEAATHLAVEHDKEFRATLPLNDLHRQILQVQARLWAESKSRMITIPPLWERLDHLAPPGKSHSKEISVAMMQNEYRATALNVYNDKQKPVTYSVSFDGLPGGSTPSYITVHEVAWTDTKSGKPVASALPVAKIIDDHPAITAIPGLCQQIWLTFHPTDLAAGAYRGYIQLQGDDGSFAAVALNLNIAPLRFPDRPTLHFGGWDYTNGSGHRGVNMVNMADLIANLQAHYVDSPWATNAVLTRAQFDDEGAITTPPDTTAFDTWVRRWPEARQYLIFANVSDSIGKWKTGTPLFQTAARNWVRFWADHANTMGIAPEKIGWLLIDEPHAPEQDARILPWAEAVQTANTGIRVWEDPCHMDMAQANQAMIALCDVLCPNRPRFMRQSDAYRAYFADRHVQGTAIELYSCTGPVKLLDPYAYFRIQAWDCWVYNATATYFWAFGDTGYGSSWNEYAAEGTDYSPLFLDATSVTDAKYMEACREGIQDYEYLVMLNEAIAKATEAGVEEGIVIAAQTLLEEAPKQVCDAATTGNYMWNVDIDRSLADQKRVEILDMLVTLHANF